MSADAVVLSGGGSKGIAQLGALHYCFEKRYYDPSKVTAYAGTSIGAIISLLLICGYTPIEIFTEIYKKPTFFKIGDVKSIWELLKDFGLMSIKPLLEEIKRLIIAKFGKVPTLAELHAKTGKNLVIAVSNVTKTHVEYFSHSTRPHLSCLDAVEMSANLPIVFQRIHYNDCYYVDGGLLDNFPIKQIDTGTNKILGIITVGVDNSSDDGSLFPYLYRLVIMPINMITELRKRDGKENSVIVSMEFDNIPLLDFSMPTDKKMQMFTQGYREAEKSDEAMARLFRISPLSVPDFVDETNAWNLEFEVCDHPKTD